MRSPIWLPLVLLPLSACLDAEDLGEEVQEIRPGQVVPAGKYEAVARYDADTIDEPPVPGNPNRNWEQRCTATMITKSAVLLAAHCFCLPTCDDDALDVTGNERRVFFDDPTTTGSDNRFDPQMTGTRIIPHPDWSWTGLDGDTPYNDFAILRVDKEAADGHIYEFDDYTTIAPAQVASERMEDGELGTMVGYGFHGVDCTQDPGGLESVKRMGTTAVDGFSSDGHRVLFDDGTIGVCHGDSGGPVFDSDGRIAGVASTRWDDESRFGSTDYIHDWLQSAACPHYDELDPDADQCTYLCPGSTGEGDCDFDGTCASGAMCALNVGKVGGLPDGWDLCWATNQLVRVYQGTSYTGSMQGLPPAAWAYTELSGVGNDAISSFRIPAGMTARLCLGGTGGGPCQEFTGNVSSLTGPLMDNVSFVNVLPGVRLYGSSFYMGSAQTFKEGTFSGAQLSLVGDNAASSMAATPGVSVHLCDGAGGTGTCHDLGGSLVALPADINNATSYVAVRLGATLYEGEDYTGALQSFPVGTFTSANFTGIANDRVTSLVVAPGHTATLCATASGGAPCRDFGPGWHSFVGFDMDDQTSWLRVQ